MSKLDMLLERWRSASAERNRLNQEVLWLEEEIRKERERYPSLTEEELQKRLKKELEE